MIPDIHWFIYFKIFFSIFFSCSFSWDKRSKRLVSINCKPKKTHPLWGDAEPLKHFIPLCDPKPEPKKPPNQGQAMAHQKIIKKGMWEKENTKDKAQLIFQFHLITKWSPQHKTPRCPKSIYNTKSPSSILGHVLIYLRILVHTITPSMMPSSQKYHLTLLACHCSWLNT